MSEQGNTSRSRWFLVILLILLCGFVGLAGVKYWLNQQEYYDEGRLDELKQAQLSGAVPRNSASNDWPQWRGPNRTGISAETGLLTDWPETDALQKLKVWEAGTGKGYASMAVADGRVYTIFQVGDNEIVVCWDAEKGDELWRFSYPSGYDNHPYEYGPGPRSSTPTVDGEHVYTVGGTGIMHCLKTQPKTADGEVVWKKHLLDDFGASNLKWGVSFSPLVLRDLVYTMPGGPNGGSLVAFDKKSGDVVWQNLNDRAGYSSPVAATIGGKEQILFFTAQGLVAVTPDEGELLWRYPWTTSYDVNVATPIVAGNYVFISSGYGKGCAVLEIEADANGNLQPHLVYKNRNMKNQYSSSVLYKDHLYGFNDTILTCMDFRSGKVAWTFPDRETFEQGSLILVDGHLILLGKSGLLAVAEANPAGIEIKSSLRVSNDLCWSLPVFSNGLLYVRDQNKIYALNLRKPPSK